MLAQKKTKKKHSQQPSALCSVETVVWRPSFSKVCKTCTSKASEAYKASQTSQTDS